MSSESFPARLRQLRESHDMTLEELAEILAISKSMMWDLEQGRRRVHSDLLQAIANHFDVSTDYLLGRTDEQGKNTEMIAFDKEAFKLLLERAKGDRTIVDYATESGVSRSYISSYINLKREDAPKPDVLKRLSNAAHNDVDYWDLMSAAGHTEEPPESETNPMIVTLARNLSDKQAETLMRVAKEIFPDAFKKDR